MKTLLLSLSLWCSAHLVSEAQISKMFIVKTGEIPVKVIPQEEQIRYPAFREGTITYTNGETITTRLNYNYLYGEMEYISPAGDTLALANEYLVKQIDIGEDLYYYLYRNGYVAVVANYPTIKLARKQNIKIVRSEMYFVGGYEPSATSNVGSSYLGEYPSFRQIYNQKTTGLLQLGKAVSHFIVDQNTRFYPAKKSTVLKLYPRHKRTISKYLKGNPVDFKQEEDLNRLIAFCSQLDK